MCSTTWLLSTLSQIKLLVSALLSLGDFWSPTLISQPHHHEYVSNLGQTLQLSKSDLANIFARLLKDERVEVREKAGKVLGGLLHCSFLSKEESAKLLDQFTKEISKKMRRKPKAGEDLAEFQAKQSKAILLRHAGVLGLSSFVVSRWQ